MQNTFKPYVLRCIIRRNLPDLIYDILVDKLGLFHKGLDCEAAGGTHNFYNSDNKICGCYYCEVKKPICVLKTIVLISPLSNPETLKPFVEECLNDKVSLISVIGAGCQEIEDEIDWILIDAGSEEDRFITTTSHPNETIEDVTEFAENWSLLQTFNDQVPDVKIIRL